jgi:hypothetical protein
MVPGRTCVTVPTTCIGSSFGTGLISAGKMARRQSAASLPRDRGMGCSDGNPVRTPGPPCGGEPLPVLHSSSHYGIPWPLQRVLRRAILAQSPLSPQRGGRFPLRASLAPLRERPVLRSHKRLPNDKVGTAVSHDAGLDPVARS